MSRVLSISFTKAFVFGIMLLTSSATAFTLSMQSNHYSNNNKNTVLPTTTTATTTTTTKLSSSTRRDVLVKSLATTVGVVVSTVAATTALPQSVSAAPIILSTNNGIKYAVLKPAQEQRTPFDKDIVAIEYTGYLSDGTIFGTFQF